MAKVLEIKRGDDVTLNISAPERDLTGGTLFFTVKDKDALDVVNLTDSNAVLKKEGSITDTHTGVIAIGATDTQNLTPGSYVYDVQFVDALGKTYTLFDTAQCKITADVTQRRS